MTDSRVSVPVWLLLDGGVKALPPAAQLALVHVAASGGATRCGNDPCGVLNGLVAGAGASFERMLGDGFIEYLDGVLRLLPPPASMETADSSPPSEHPPVSAPHPRRPPSQSPEQQRLRKVRSWFESRTGPCRDVPKSETWSTWSTSPAGVDLLRVGRPRYVGNKGSKVVPVDRNNARNKSGTTQEQGREQPPSDSPFPPETKKNDESNRSAGVDGNKPGTGREQPTGTTDGNNPLVAALVAAGGIVQPDYETARLLEGVLSRVGVTLNLATAWGTDLATSMGRKVTWPWLRSPDAEVTAQFLRHADMAKGHEPWSRVGDGFSLWKNWHTKKTKARAKLPPPPPPIPSRDVDPEFAARFRAEIAAQFPATPKDAAHG